MTDNRATPATRRDEATDRLAEIEARIAATVPPPAVEVDGEMVTPLSHAHAVAIGSWPWRSDIVWLVAQLRRTKPTLRAPEVTDVERLAKIIHGASWHTCELGMDDRPLSLNTCRKIAGRIATDVVRVAGALGTPEVTDEGRVWLTEGEPGVVIKAEHEEIVYFRRYRSLTPEQRKELQDFAEHLKAKQAAKGSTTPKSTPTGREDGEKA